ncbi:RNA polymerase sigma factor [Agromyces sp. MMS24-K17]|uniref:RNA polymerase sigma factor n=1 Tax=Agromyces sp. MMS24-K17 TaxID=3372850 RepID=UPI003753EE70
MASTAAQPAHPNGGTMRTEASDRVDPAAASVLRTMFTEQPDRLRRRAVSLGLRREDAEDAAQSAATVAIAHIDQVQCADEPAICAWVDTIARRVVADEFRRRGRERTFLDEIEREVGGLAPGGTVFAPSAEAEAEHRERVTATAIAIQSLPDALREVMELRYGHDLPTRRIAEELGLSDAAVRQRLTRARAAVTDSVGVSD